MRADALRLSLPLLGLAACANDTSLTNYCPANILINEISAASKNDWIELYNADEEAVELEGYRLSRTPDEVEFEIPAEMPVDGDFTQGTTLNPGEFLLLMADTYVDGELAADNLVVGFDLNRDGDGVWLRAPDNYGFAECDAAVYPDQHDNYSWARDPDGGEAWCDASAPTPGAPNAPCLCGAEDSSPWC